MYKIVQNDIPLTVAEKIASYGTIQDMQPSELLEVFLTTETRDDTKSLADNLTKNLRGLASIDYNTLIEEGVAHREAIGLLAIIELTKRSLRASNTGTRLFSNYELAARLMPEIGIEKQEVLFAFYLDTQNRIIEERLIFKGSVSRSVACPREILYYACRNMAANVIIAHNHPSGNVNPSLKDDKFTEKLQFACNSMEIKLLDHLIIANNKYYSYLEEGKL